jgi:predicted RNA-binding Zn ribbon-like protein
MSNDPVRARSQFFGGRVCLDFANTVDWRTSASPQELIPDYATLLTAAVTRLRARGAHRAAAAGAVLDDAHALRIEIWQAAIALSGGRPAPLQPFNRRLAALPAQPPLVRSGTRYVLGLPGKALDEPLWPVLWSLTALLSSEDGARVGSCRAEGCGWFFVDESPNRSRMWCSSDVCGNRERARRAYDKRRSTPRG